MRVTRLPALLALGWIATLSVQAHAATVLAGSSTAKVVGPLSITPVNAMRFGQLVRPTALGTVIITPAGVVTTTGGMIGNTSVGAGRGPASFAIHGDANRAFVVNLPNRITVRNGTANMRINALTSNTTAGVASLSAAGGFTLNVGGTIRVAANQRLGAYSATYNVTVTYQ